MDHLKSARPVSDETRAHMTGLVAIEAAGSEVPDRHEEVVGFAQDQVSGFARLQRAIMPVTADA